VAILARLLRFIFWVVLATWLGRKLLGWLFGSAAEPDVRRASSRPRQTLHRDPVCGTYVSPEVSLKLEHNGQVHHFCSAQCRERFPFTSRPAARTEKVGASA